MTGFIVCFMVAGQIHTVLTFITAPGRGTAPKLQNRRRRYNLFFLNLGKIKPAYLSSLFRTGLLGDTVGDKVSWSKCHERIVPRGNPLFHFQTANLLTRPPPFPFGKRPGGS